MSVSGWLIQALVEAQYIEDVRALKHFVFHPRYNGCSNFCLICDCAVDTEGDWDEAHLPGCAYPQAVARVRGRVAEPGEAKAPEQDTLCLGSRAGL